MRIENFCYSLSGNLRIYENLKIIPNPCYEGKLLTTNFCLKLLLRLMDFVYFLWHSLGYPGHIIGDPLEEIGTDISGPLKQSHDS